MRKLTVIFCVLTTLSLNAQTYIQDWGLEYYHPTWPILNDSSTAAGSASIGGEQKGWWTLLHGSFGRTIQATLDSAIVVRGQLEFVGNGLGPVGDIGIRYALTWQEDEGILENQCTDSARWSVYGSNYGYEFTPKSGADPPPSGGGQPGKVLTIVNGNWYSTYSNWGWTIAPGEQIPKNAEMIEGKYDWAISVQLLADGTNEVRWYLVYEDNISYWYGGIAIDTGQVTTKFKGICFGIGEFVPEGLTQFNLTEVQVDKGEPIEIPPAPWEPYYIDQWGVSIYHGWPILNDSTTAAGEASIGGETKNGWATLRGSFGQTIEATLDSAVIVSGQLEFVGADMGFAYTPLRYALTWQEDEGILEHQYTDSAAWSVNSGYWGYQWTPRTGPDIYTGGGAGPIGTFWTINNGNWASTYSSNGWDIALGDRVPHNAELVEGVYDWAISVQPLSDGTNEIRWYLQHEDKDNYWYTGIAIDTAQVTTKFNGICFGIGDLAPENLIRFNLTKVQVDKGEPVKIPPAPWQKYYVDQWGLAEYHGWPILNDSTTLPGYASIGGETRDGIASLRGSFGQDLAISKDIAIVVSGQIEFIGGSGGDDYFPIRYALTHQADEGELLYVGTDSMQWSGIGSHSGYEFHPRTGQGQMSNGPGGLGTVWTTINGNWVHVWQGGSWPLAAINQGPRDAEIVAGIYDFTISVHAIDDSTNEIRWYMMEENGKYWFGGIVQGFATTTVFNGIEFGIDGEKYTRFNIIAMSVDLGDPLPDPLPKPLYFYIENWGIIGNRFDGWITDPGYSGNVSISGDSPNAEMIAIRGEFTKSYTPAEEIGVIISGELEFEGGGIEAANSLRFGVFYSDDPGTLITEPPDSMRWTGREDKHYGYLFIPPSGTNNSTFWGAEDEIGNWGDIVNNVWFEPQADGNYTLGTAVHYPPNAVAGEGTYSFGISITLPDSGGRELRFKLMKEDQTYGFAGFAIDDNVLLDTLSFNCISFVLDSGNTIIALHLRDVLIGWGNPITLPGWVTSVEEPGNDIPIRFYLSQNYPNPFNPVTNIKYSLPQNSLVTLQVFDILGRKVATLINEEKPAGNYEVEFNGSNLSSGVYFYNLRAGEFVSTKKLVLIK